VQLLSSASSACQAAAALALSKLSAAHSPSREAIVVYGGISPLVHLLRGVNVGASVGTDVTMFSSLGSAHTDAQQQQRAAAEAQRKAATTLAHLAANHTVNQASIAAAGAIPLLVALLGRQDCREQAAAAL